MSEETGKNYASFKPCGCIWSVARVDPGDKFMARKVAKWIAKGEDVRQVETEWVRQSARFSCDKCKPQPKGE